MQRNLLTVAALAVFAPLVHAANLSPATGSFVVTQQAGSYLISFSSLSLAAFEFTELSPTRLDYGIGPVTGRLTSVSINATLDATSASSYASDLTIYVNTALVTDGLLQVGEFSDFGASEYRVWANGASSAPGTTVIDTVVLQTPLTFSGGASDPHIYLGNGYGSSDGTWTGSVRLNFTAAVPEPESWALFLAGGAGVLGWSARRRHARPASS